MCSCRKKHGVITRAKSRSELSRVHIIEGHSAMENLVAFNVINNDDEINV